MRYPGPMWRVVGIVYAGVLALLLVWAPDVSRPREAALAARITAVAQGVPDASGRTWPLFVHDEGERWYQPLAVYPAALLLRLGMPERYALRLPNLVAAGAVVVCVYGLAFASWRSRRTAATAAALTATTPAVLVFGRSAGADLMLPALVTAWLLALQSWRAWRGSSLAALGGLTLGLSAWTQPAGVLTVPIAFALGYVLIAPEPRSRRVLAIAAVAALVPFVIDALWLLRHPDAYIDTLGRWAIHPAHVRNPWAGLLAATKWDVLARRTSDFWSYVSPTFLFGSGAVFSPALAIPVALGICVGDAPPSRAAATNRSDGMAAILTLGFLAAPLAAVLLDAPRDAGLVLAMVPFGTLLAARGIVWLEARRRLRVVGWGLLALAILEGASMLVS